MPEGTPRDCVLVGRYAVCFAIERCALCAYNSFVVDSKQNLSQCQRLLTVYRLFVSDTPLAHVCLSVPKRLQNTNPLARSSRQHAKARASAQRVSLYMHFTRCMALGISVEGVAYGAKCRVTYTIRRHSRKCCQQYSEHCWHQYRHVTLFLDCRDVRRGVTSEACFTGNVRVKCSFCHPVSVAKPTVGQSSEGGLRDRAFGSLCRPSANSIWQPYVLGTTA